MLVYDEKVAPLNDSFDGDSVALLATVGGKVDKHFRRNYAWAKHAADVGRLKKITVVVSVDGTDWVHSVGAVTSALAGGRLHAAGVFRLHVENLDYADTSKRVLEALKELAPEKPKEVAPVVDKAGARGRRPLGKDDKGE